MIHASPYVAQSWLNYVLDEINTYIQITEVGEIEQSIEYLNSQLAETNKTDARKALSNILEQQINTLMLSEVSSGYVLKTIDSASLPEIKSGPIRSKICISLTLAGFSLAFLFSSSYLSFCFSWLMEATMNLSMAFYFF